jgi:hypothetical protein
MMRIETPAARSTDPVTSHLAAEAITKSGERQRQIDIIAAFVRENPGLTSKEIAVAMDREGIDRYTTGRRLPDAEGIYVKRGAARRCTASKGMPLCITWWPLKRKYRKGVAHG